ncbi:MAG: hypothetical protein AAB434_02920, partial [Planctomycetota bacterium]
MKDEIRRILEMVQTGKLTQEQGAEMIEALSQKEAPQAPPPAPSLGEYIKTAVSSALGSFVVSSGGPAGEGNSVQMSRV